MLQLLLLLACGGAAAQERPGLLLREDWKETPPALPVTQEHVANPDLVLGLYGPGKAGVKKSHHEKPADDPYYIWTGECAGNCAVTLRPRSGAMDLTGQAKVRWRAKHAGFRHVRLVVKLASGDWLVSEEADGPAFDWREREFILGEMRWRRLDINRVVEGRWVASPDLSRVAEIGWTDLMPGGGSDACSRVDWIEVYARAAKR